MNIIELKDITFGYEESEPKVFKSFDFFVEKGKCVVLLGDNGSGKTTLFRILNGLSFPETGNYFFDGIDITEKYLKKNKNSKIFHKRIGYLFQNVEVMLFNATVFDEIAFGPRQMGLSDEEINGRVKDMLGIFGIEELAKKAPYHLSGGQKKKVAMAAVMALNPEVIIMDEPFSGLDKNSQKELMDFLMELKKAGKTLIIATHNQELTDMIADKTVTLERETNV